MLKRVPRLLIAVLSLSMCLGLLAAVLPQHYVFPPAGNMPGAIQTVPFGLNLTRIVGYYQGNQTNNSYVQTGASFRSVEPLSTRRSTSYLNAINRRDVAVGGYCAPGCNPTSAQHGYTYNYATGAITTIDYPGTGISTAAYGINDKGQIVGGYCLNFVCPGGAANPTNHGFVDNNGVFTTIDYPGAQLTEVSGINNAGVMVGIYVIHDTGPHAYIYQNGVFSNIDYPNSSFALARSINEQGVVAGLFSDLSGASHGFLWLNGKFTQIDVPGAAATGIYGINDEDLIIGGWTPFIGFDNNFRGVPVAAENGNGR